MVIYKYTIKKGSGTSGGVKYTKGMNVEIAVTGMAASGSGFNSTTRKIFIEEFARKYNIPTNKHNGIGALFLPSILEIIKF